VRVGERIFGVLAERLVEVFVLLVGNIILAASPDSLDLVDDFPVPNLLRNGLHLGLSGLLRGFFLALISDLHIVTFLLLLFFFDY